MYVSLIPIGAVNLCYVYEYVYSEYVFKDREWTRHLYFERINIIAILATVLAQRRAFWNIWCFKLIVWYTCFL